MKSQMSSILAVTLLVSALSGVSRAVAADDTSKAAVPTGGTTSVGSPFGDGTGKRQLTPAEKQELLEYAENSNAILSDALDSAKGRGFAEANKIYLAAIKKVVIASFESKPRSELILRISLNQALELTFGVPTVDGKGVMSPGVLAKSVNQELLTVILEDSIKLAVNYYQDDRKAIQSGNLVNLPYMAFSAQRLALAQKWLASVIEWKYAYDFSVTALQQWLNVALVESNLQRVTFAEEIVKVDGVLKDLDSEPLADGDAETLKQRVRFLRGLVRKTVVSLGDKLRANGQNPAPVNPGQPTIPGSIVDLPPPVSGDYGVSCIQILASNGFDVGYGSRSAICARFQSASAVQALAVVAKSNGTITDSELSQIATYTYTEQASCAATLVKNGFQFSYGNRAAICGRIASGQAVSALSIVAGKNGTTSDTELAWIVTYQLPEQVACASALVGNGFSFDYGRRAEFCALFQTQDAVNALSETARFNSTIEDRIVQTFAGYSNRFQSGCVSLLARNGFNISYGRRAEICGRFRTDNGLTALKAVAEKSSTIDDATLDSLSRL